MARPRLALDEPSRKIWRDGQYWISQRMGRAKKRGLRGRYTYVRKVTKETVPVVIRCCEILIERHYARLKETVG